MTDIHNMAFYDLQPKIYRLFSAIDPQTEILHIGMVIGVGHDERFFYFQTTSIGMEELTQVEETANHPYATLDGAESHWRRWVYDNWLDKPVVLNKIGEKADVIQLPGTKPDNEEPTRNDSRVPNEIQTFMHCRKCVEGWRTDPEESGHCSPRDYARLEAGWTQIGLQVRCVRHDCNVVHINFEGQRHPAETRG